MDRSANRFNELAAVEPTFQVDGPWCGHFELDGRSVRCAMDRAEWLQATIPLAGSARDLVRRQGNLPLPVKVIGGPALMGEMPCGAHLPGTFAALREALHLGIDLLESTREELVAGSPAETDLPARLNSILEQSAFVWEDDKGIVSTRTQSGKVVATLQTASVVFRAPIAHLGRANATSIEALEHFIVNVNARFRLVRGAFVADRLVGEVALSMATLTPSLVDHAVRGISTSVRMTKKTCMALVDEQLAERYLEFHTHRKDSHADTHY